MSRQDAFYNFSQSHNGFIPAVLKATQLERLTSERFVYASLLLNGSWRYWTGTRAQARLEEEETGALVLRVPGLLSTDFKEAKSGLYESFCWQIGGPEYD